MNLPNLMQPLRIGPTELQCRIVSTAHQTTLVHDHMPTDDFVAYHEARAAGGVGMIIMEAVAIAPSGLLTAHTVGGYLPEIVDGYRRVAAAVRPHGTRLFVQLFHGGREVIASAPRPVVVSSSALPSHRYHTEPRALRTDEVEEIVTAYGRCAGLAAEAGLDGIEITAAHGYLGQQFFEPTWNERSDRYGEELVFLREVLESVRANARGLAVGIRLSADSEAARGIVKHLAGLVDYVHVAIGNSATFDGCVNIVPPLPTPRNAIADLTPAFRIGVPLVATTRVVDPRDADGLIERGVADALGMNRALITDPDMPRKARSGREDDVIRCIGCNACIAHYHAETPIRCAQNPRTGRERSFPRAAPVPTPLGVVVVVGAGPAGLAAAAEALDLGHRVTVFEAGPHAGGQAWLAGRAPANRELWASLERNYARVFGNERATVRLGTTADADAVVAAQPALVVLATGARPFASRHRLDGIRVLQAWDVLAGEIPDGRIVIADWGRDSIGLDCAELLAEAGRDVTIAIGAIYPGEALHQYHRNAYIGRLSRAGVRLEHYLGLESAADGVIAFRNVCAPELRASIEADALVVALGRVPNDDLAAELRERGVALSEAGDCRSPRGLEEAILEGTTALHDGMAVA